MTCTSCHLDIEKGERILANFMKTFVFKPADVADTVNPAEVSPNELMESRREHQRTAMATVFAFYGAEELPAGAFNVRHAFCNVMLNCQSLTTSGEHPIFKHDIRYRRSVRKELH